MSTPNPLAGLQTGNPQQPNGASISDVLTTLKNLVNALNNATQTFLNINGAATQENIVLPTLISGAKRLCKVSIVTEGDAVGFIYDSGNLNDVFTPIWAIPTALGMVNVNMPVTNGIVIVPGDGQNVTVTYS
jgi:hypothetical protein